MTFQEFIKKNKLSITSKRADGTPSNWSKDSKSWLCSVQRGEHIGECNFRVMSFEYHTGSAIEGPPKLADLLYCLAMDASAKEEECFEDWAENLGYDTDSRKAEKTYQACLKNADDLCYLLGNDAFNTLLECEEE